MKPTKQERKPVILSRLRLLAAMDRAKLLDSRFTPLWPVIQAVRQNGNRHYLTESVDVRGKVSYAATPRYKYDPQRRVRTTLQRYLTRTYKPDVPESVLESFCQEVRAILSPATDSRFQVVRGSAVVEAYRNHFGGSSCMTGDCDYTRIYAENPDVVELLMFIDTANDLEARALLWTTTTGETVVDRIYPNSGWHIPLFHKHAASNGWVVRRHNSVPDDFDAIFEDEKHREVEVAWPSNDLWPYMDSFRFTSDDESNSILTLSTKYERCDTVLDDTEGGFNGRRRDDRIACYDCRAVVDEDESWVDHDGDYYCRDCFHARYAYCSHCNRLVCRSDVTDVEDGGGEVCDGCLTCYYIRCVACDEWVRHRDASRNPNNEWECDGCYDYNWKTCAYEDCVEVVAADEADLCEDCAAKVADESEEAEPDAVPQSSHH